MESCSCGFTDASVALHEIEQRSRIGIAAISALLLADPVSASQRPSPERWSAVEYAAHVRDVLLTIHSRVVTGLVEDNPTFAPLYREERVALGLYRPDTAEAVSDEVVAARAMFVRLFSQIAPESLERPVRYGFPNPTPRSVGWMGKQAVHEIEHHLDDIRLNAALLAR